MNFVVYGLGINALFYDQSKMTHYVIPGEILTSTIGVPLIGNIQWVAPQYFFDAPVQAMLPVKIGLFTVWVPGFTTGKLIDPGKNHGMDAFLKAWNLTSARPS